MTRIGDMTDAELNAAMAREVMGWADDGTCPVYIGGTVKRIPGSATWEKWSPATDIAAAFEVVERMREPCWRYDVTIEGFSGLPWIVAFVHVVHSRLYKASGADLPRAICEAALAAMRSET